MIFRNRVVENQLAKFEAETVSDSFERFADQGEQLKSFLHTNSNNLITFSVERPDPQLHNFTVSCDFD